MRHRQEGRCLCRSYVEGKEEKDAPFFVPEENRTENEIVIHGDDVNHIRNVLRMTKGKR